MPFPIPNSDDYDDLLYTLQHMAVDRCTDLVGRVNAHADILDPDNDEGEVDRLFSAQLGLDGSEEEIDLTQALITMISNIIVIRRARAAIHQSPNEDKAWQQKSNSPDSFSENLMLALRPLPDSGNEPAWQRKEPMPAPPLMEMHLSRVVSLLLPRRSKTAYIGLVKDCQVTRLKLLSM